MHPSRLLAGLLVTVVALSACRDTPPVSPDEGAPSLAELTLAETTVGVSYSATLGASAGRSPYSFSATGLPPGISVASDSGKLTGSASEAGEFQVQVTVTGANSKQASKSYTLKVYPAVAFKTGALPQATAEAPYSATLELEGGKAPFTLRLAAGELPPSVSFDNNSRQLSGTFPSAGTVAFTFEATDVHGSKATRSFSFPVAAALRITTTTLPVGNVGDPYAEPITTTGGRAPLALSAQSGALPPGLSFSGDSLSGTPTSGGRFTFVLAVTDANGAVSTVPLTVDIYSHLAPRITTTTLPEGVVGKPYTQAITGAEGIPPYSFAVTSGALPAGLSLSSSGVLSGSPTAAETRTFQVTLTDSRGQRALRTLALATFPVLAVQTASLAEGYQGRAYNQTLSATGGKAPFQWLPRGTLPAGLSLTSAGVLSGAPTATGTFSVDFTLTDGTGQTVNGTLPLTLYALPAITTASFRDGYVGDSYDEPSVATGGKGTLTFSLASGALPEGVTLNASTGRLVGTPTQVGTFDFALRVRDANSEEATRPLQVAIYALPTLTTAAVLPGAYAGQPYTATLAATGGKGTLTFSRASGALPTGLSLSATGTIDSTVDAAVAHATKSTFTLQVADANGKTGSRAFEITTFKLPEILSAPLTQATEGVEYRRSEASAERVQTQYGQGAFTFVASGLPSGLSIHPGTGELWGTPDQDSAGTYTVAFTATDAGNKIANATRSLTVVKPRATNYGGVIGLAPAGGRITDTLTVFALNGRIPLPGVGVRVRKNGVEYSPIKQGLTDAQGKVVFTGLGLNGTTDTVDITGNGANLVNVTVANVNSSLVTLRMNTWSVLGRRALSSGAYDPTTRRFLVTGGNDSTLSNSLFYGWCLNDVVEAQDITQRTFRTLVPGGLTTSPAPRQEASMATASGVAVLFGGRNCGNLAEALGDTWEFELATNTWTQTTPDSSPTPRRGAALVREASGSSVLMVGGIRASVTSNEVWRYTPAANIWTRFADAPFNRAYMASTLHTGTGELWFCGGRSPATVDTCHSLNSETLTWTARPSLPSARSEFGMTYDPFTENLYAFGGRTASGTSYGDLLVLRKGAAAWESVIPVGATPPPRHGHLVYFDLDRRELVVTQGNSLSSDPTARSSRVGDLWTYNGTAWTERGAATPVAPSHTLSGMISGGPTNGQAVLRAVSPTGFVNSVTVALDASGRGAYSLSSIPPGEPLAVAIVGENNTLPYPNNLWSYTDAELPPLTGDLSRDFTLPTGPAVVLQATGKLLLPASWRGHSSFTFAEPELYVPGYPVMGNGRPSPDFLENAYDVAFVATSAPKQQVAYIYASSERTCEDHGVYKAVTPGNQDLTVGSTATGLAPGQAECIPAGPRGVSPARLRASLFNDEFRSAVADLDGDSFADVVLPRPFSVGLSIAWGTPNLTSGPTVTNHCCDVDRAHSVAIGDFNRDGRPDLAATETFTGKVQVKLARSDVRRAFGAATAYTVGTQPTGIATADVNQDGFLDLLVANFTDSTVSFLPGTGSGTFGAAETITLAGTAPTAVQVANVDGDTALDLVVVVNEGISITLDGFTQGPFGDSRRVTAGTSPYGVVVGRLNGDSLPDLAVVNRDSNDVTLLLGAGGGTFASPVHLPVSLQPEGIALAELTGDAHLDLAVVSPAHANITLLQGASTGAFTVHSRISVAGMPRSVAATDFNGDGLNDVVVAAWNPGGLFVLPGQRPLPTAAAGPFSFTAPSDSRFVWVLHGIHGYRRYWDYYRPIQPGAVSYSLPLASTLAPSSEPVAPASGQLTLNWTPWVKRWDPGSPHAFHPRQFSLASNLRVDSDTQPGAHLYQWP
jgi:hypothetical protein